MGRVKASAVGTLDERLTPRQREFLTYFYQGHTRKQIGGLMGINESRVNQHLVSILQRLQLESSFQLIVFGERRGLIEPSVLPH